MRTKRLSGFSLMEMMIVLLIVSIVAAASAPMINRRMVSEAANGCEWSLNGAMDALFYNNEEENKAVAIGTNVAGGEGDAVPRLHIASGGNPHIRLTNGGTAANISFLNNNISFTAGTIQEGTTGGVAIGPNASLRKGMRFLPNGAIAIGNVTAKQQSAITIGNNVQTEAGHSLAHDSYNAIAIGTNLNAHSWSNNSIIMGMDSSSNATNSIIIGQKVTTSKNADHSILIGRNLSITQPNSSATSYSGSIGIGSSSISGDDSVVITPGKTTVKGNYSVLIGGGTPTVSDIGTAVGVGAEVSAEGETSVAIGFRAHATAQNAVAIGGGMLDSGGARADGTDSVALGSNTDAKSEGTVAIGISASANGTGSIAIGSGAMAAKGEWKMIEDNHITTGDFKAEIAGDQGQIKNSVAIGNGARAFQDNQIVLGTADTTVYIPGKLIVDQTCYLGRLPKQIDGADTGVYLRMGAAGDWADTTKMFRFYQGTWTEVIDGWFSTTHRANPRMYKDQSLNADNERFTGYPLSPYTKDYTPSDRRQKNVGEAFKAGLAEIKKLELFHYTYKKDSKKTPHVGVMAQDLMKIFPDAVWKGEDGFYRIRMEDMFYALINAVKELDAKIDAILNNEIAELRKENQEQQKLIEKLEKQNAKLEKDNEKIMKRLDILEKKLK